MCFLKTDVLIKNVFLLHKSKINILHVIPHLPFKEPIMNFQVLYKNNNILNVSLMGDNSIYMEEKLMKCNVCLKDETNLLLKVVQKCSLVTIARVRINDIQ